MGGKTSKSKKKIKISMTQEEMNAGSDWYQFAYGDPPTQKDYDDYKTGKVKKWRFYFDGLGGYSAPRIHSNLEK